MKVIDLLNKIANGEEIPKKIKFKGIDRIYEYNRMYNWFDDNSSDNCKDIFYICELNDEVEIIEEDKKMKTIEQLECYHQYDECWVKDKFHQDQKGSLVDEIIIDKINEIIDKLNKG